MHKFAAYGLQGIGIHARPSSRGRARDMALGRWNRAAPKRYRPRSCLHRYRRIYGSEEVVGEAIREVRSKALVATKASPRNFRRADLLQAADGSLKRFRTTYIDLYQLHWSNYTVGIEETMGAMEELVDAGKIRFIGVSNFSVHALEKAQAALSKHKIVSNRVRYSLMERTVERAC